MPLAHRSAKLLTAAATMGRAATFASPASSGPEYLEAFRSLANLATKTGVEGNHFEILAPLVSLTKPEIIRLGMSLHVNYGLTTSCYDPTDNGAPCEECDSCLIRAAGFEAVNTPDPRVLAFMPSGEQ